MKEPKALVLAVDTPLVPVSLLAELVLRHRRGITLVSCGGEAEPLIGVYDKELFRDCGEILCGTAASLQKLFQKFVATPLEYRGDPALLMNCNTPEEYWEILSKSPCQSRTTIKESPFGMGIFTHVIRLPRQRRE